MKTRCALKILFRIRSVFPKEKSIAQSILDELEKIAKMDIQKDIKTLSNRYMKNLTDLMPRMKDSQKVPVQEEKKTERSSKEESSNKRQEK